VIDGHWGVGTKSDLVLAAYPTPSGLQEDEQMGLVIVENAGIIFGQIHSLSSSPKFGSPHVT
jgi:hypothetical protein